MYDTKASYTIPIGNHKWALKMNRVCVIDIAGLTPRLLRGRDSLWLNSLQTPPQAMMPTFPAIANSLQASVTTGREPGAHGVVAGGVYRRQSFSVSFAERSNTLLTKKRFWHARAFAPSPKVSLMFWSNPLAGGGDVVLGATTYACRCGAVSHQPRGLYDDLVQAFGQFEFDRFQGPGAFFGISDWISRASAEVWKNQRPDLQWVFLPGVDFELVRGGSGAPAVEEAILAVDQYARRIAKAVESDGGDVIVLSTSPYVDVSRVVHPNVKLAKAGLLKTVQTPDGLMPDLANSQAFAMVDHQIAHIFCSDENVADQAAVVVGALDGVAGVVPRQELFSEGMGHDRCGERIALCKPDSWFSYRWWDQDQAAPDVAQHVGASGKCGYDPCELLPAEGGFDIDESHVRASCGLVSNDPSDHCILAGSYQMDLPAQPRVTDLAEMIHAKMVAEVPSVS